MKTGINDLITNKTIALERRIEDKIAEKNKGFKPFGKEPVPAADLVFAMRNLGYQDWVQLQQEYGGEAVAWFISEAVKAEKRGNYAELGAPNTAGG